MTAPASYRVGLNAADGARVEFEALPGQSLVKAAARAGYLMTIGCLQGRCAICRAHLLHGTVAPLRRPSPNSVTPHNGDAADVVRLCSVSASSHLEVAPFSPWHHAPRLGDQK